MANYVNEVKKDNVIYDIQDKRLQVTVEDAGKMVSVNEQGELTLVPAPSGGTKLYKHSLNIGSGNYLYVISNSSEKITSLASLTDINIIAAKLAGPSKNGGVLTLRYKVAQNIISTYGIDNNGELFSFDISSIAASVVDEL